jgi:polar amino acid transport system substrate-binding protein
MNASTRQLPMWRAFNLFVCAFLILVAVLGHGSANAQTALGHATLPSAKFPVAESGRRIAPEFLKIEQRGELIIAMLATDTPPFFYMSGSELKGIDVDLAREIGKELGVPVRFDRTAKSFNEVVDKVSRGEADLGISKISRTLARTKSVLFSDPYVTFRHALILNRLEFAKLARDQPTGQVVKNFKGRLGVIEKSAFHDFALVNFPNAAIRTYPGWPDLVAAVIAGDVVAGYRDEFEVKRLLTERPAVALTLRTMTIKDRYDTLGVAVGADASMLRSFVNLMLVSRMTRLEIGDVLRLLPPPSTTEAAK